MRCWVLVGALGVGGCLRPAAYPCERDEQCVKAGLLDGTCEDEGYCSFPDPMCDSMSRFSELAPPSIAGECVAEDGSTGTTAPSTTSTTTIDPIPTTTTETTDTPTTDASTSDAPSSSSSSTGEPAMPEPVGWWPLDEEAGLVAADLGTGMTPGVLMDGPQWVPGHIGNALSFDGVDDWVTMGDADVHDLDEFTVAAWIWIVAPGTVSHPSVVDKTHNYRLRLESMSTRVGAAFRDPDAMPINAQEHVTCGDEEELPLEEWHHIATTYEIEGDVRTLRVWVDGAIVCEVQPTGGDGTPVYSGSALRLGYWNGSGGSYFNGLIDDVRIYDRALTGEQIETLASM